MTNVLGIRPFVPARDYNQSIAFYQALGFTSTHSDAHVTLLGTGGSTFILQNFCHAGHAENTMVQLLVPDTWGRRTTPRASPRSSAPRPPGLP